MTSKQLWQYVQTNKLWRIATPCNCAGGRTALQLTLPAAGTDLTTHVHAVLGYAARCIRSLALAGAGCNALAQSSDMADALQALGASDSLRAVRFEPSVDTDRLAPLLHSLENNKALESFACSIEAYVTPAIQRLVEARSAADITVYVDDIAQLRFLRSAAAATATRAIASLHVSACTDATALQLAAVLAAVPSLRCREIRLLQCAISQRTLATLERQCIRLGNSCATLLCADVPLERRQCTASAHQLKCESPSVERRDVSLFNVILFTRPTRAMIKGKAVTPSGTVFSTVRAAPPVPMSSPMFGAPWPPALVDVPPAQVVVAPVPPPPPPAPAKEVAPVQKPRRVRGVVATHCQRGPGEMAAEFAKVAECQEDVVDTELHKPPTCQCANTDCVNRTIDHSEFHIELACHNGHIIRAHNKHCEAALNGLCPDCGVGIVGERTLVRINERGERIVKPAAPAVVAVAQVVAPPIVAKEHAALPRKSKAALRRERRAQQQKTAAAATAAQAEPHKAVQQEHQSAPPPALTIDDSEQVRRLAAGQVDGMRVQKATVKPLLVKLATKKKTAIKNNRRWSDAHELTADAEQTTIITAISDDNADEEQKDHAAALTGQASVAVSSGTAEASALSMVTSTELVMQQSDSCLVVGLVQQKLMHLARAGETAALRSMLERLEMLVVAHQQELQW
jgi:hypothetical protein